MKQGFALLLLVGIVAGCGGENSMDTTIKGWFNPAPKKTNQQLVAQAFDEVDPDQRREALEELGKHDWALREPYLKRYAQLTQPEAEVDPTVRGIAVRLVGKANDETYRPFVLGALKDPAALVRSDACVVLAYWRSDEMPVAVVSLATRDDNADVRAQACGVLQHYPTEGAYDTLRMALADRKFLVRRSANDSLVLMCARDFGPDQIDWPPTLVLARTTAAPLVVRQTPWWKPAPQSRWNPETWFNRDGQAAPAPLPVPAPPVAPAPLEPDEIDPVKLPPTPQPPIPFDKIPLPAPAK